MRGTVARLIYSNGVGGLLPKQGTFLKTISSTLARPLYSTPLQLGGRAANIAAAPLVLEKEGFLSLLPGIVDDICNDPSIADLHPHISEHMEAAIKYNIVGGKMNRGLSVPVSYAVLTPNATQADLEKAAILGWTVEFLQAFFLVADDIMDGSETRRGQPCWFRKPEIGLIAFNDSIILETCVYSILARHFSKHPSYTGLLQALLESTRLTSYGQAIDLTTASAYNRVRGNEGSLDMFTMDRYSCIVKYKTSHYSFVLPVHLAMRLAGIEDEEKLNTSAAILNDIGHYFQVCDDYLDCYGDPKVTGKLGTDIQDGKCSWLVATALEKSSEAQRRTLESNYGSSDAQEVAAVLEVYGEVGVKEAFTMYEEEFHAKMVKKIAAVDDLPPSLFSLFLDRVYKRKS